MSATSNDRAVTPVMDLIKSRRVTRHFRSDPVPRSSLETLLVAARWAPVAGNIRLNRFVVVQDQATIDQVRLVSPGMERKASCAALVVVCVDDEVCRQHGLSLDRDPTVLIDVGTVTMTILLAAAEAGLGACPTTSFSGAGVSRALALPASFLPRLMLQVGWPGVSPEQHHPRRRISPGDLSWWHSP